MADAALAQAPKLSDGQIEENALRDGGFSDEEVSQWKGETAQHLQDGGFSAQEIRDYFGTKGVDDKPIKEHLAKNMPHAAPTNQAPQGPVEAKNVWEAVKAGWQGSVLGLKGAGHMPDTVVGEDAGIAQHAASAIGQMAGDLPAMAGGAVVGAELGPIGMAAGGFAAPAAMRKILIDNYQKGHVDSPGEFASRVVSTTWEAAKGAITGAASELTGGTGGMLLGGVGKVAGEVAAQTVVSKGLEGQLPNKNDFINGAVAIGGLHAVGFGVGKTGYVTNKLMNIYAETGLHPAEINEHANTDPAFKGELLSENPNLPKEAAPPVLKEEPPQSPSGDNVEPIVPDKAREEILSRIGEKAEPEKAPLIDRAKDGFNSMYAKHLDYTSVVGDVLKEIGDQPLDENNAQVLMRLHAASMDKVRTFVEDGTRDFHTGEKNGESYMDIINDVKAIGPEAIDNFNAYRIASRSLELAGRGLEQTGDRANDKAFVDAHPEIKPLLDRYVEFRNRTLDYLGESGRYSKEAISAMKELNKSYTPLKKILEPDTVTGKWPMTAKDIKKIGNSDLQLVDPFESDMRDVQNMIQLAHQTEATNVFIDNMAKAEDPSAFFKESENQKGIPSKTQIAGYVDGKRTLYDVPEEVADSINRMAGNKPAINAFTGLLKPFANMLRLGTVNNPLFGLRHAWRNQLTAPTLSQTGLKPFQALLYAPEYLAKGDSYKQFVYDGGAVSSIMPMDKSYVDGKIYELNKEAPFIDKAWNTVKTAAGFSHMAITLNDNIVRFAEYQRMLEKGASRTESAFAAREVLPDFQKAGLQKSAIQSMTAFLNVHMQGQSRMFQEMGNNPYGYIAKNLAYITVPSVLLAAAQSGDDAIQDLPNWQKYNYWTVHTSNWREANSLAEAMSVKDDYPSNVRQMPDGKWQVNDGTIFRVQKPFTNGIFFGSMIEASLDAWKKKDTKGFGEFVKNVASSVIAEPIPTALTPVLEQAVNRNFYTGQPIVHQSMENKLPEMQYDRYTSETAKAIGKILTYVPLANDIGPKDARLTSPAVIENYIHGWGGTMGNYVVDLLDRGLVAAGVAPDKVTPTKTLSDIPFVKEFTVRFPNAHPQSVADFEDRYSQANKVSNSIKQLMKEGDIQGAVKLQDRYALNMDKLTGVDKAIRNLNASIQKVNQTQDIEPVQKRQLIDMMMYQMGSMAKQGNHLMDEFEQNVKNKQGSN